MAHASEFLNDNSLQTRIRLDASYKSVNSDYACTENGLDSFANGISNTREFLSRDCGTIISKDGAAHMLLTRQYSGSNGIAYTSSVCTCNNR